MAGRSKFYVLVAAPGLALWWAFCWLRYQVSETRIDECFDILTGVQQNVCIRNAMESRDGALIWAIGLPLFLSLFLIVPFLISSAIRQSRISQSLVSGTPASPPAPYSEPAEFDERTSKPGRLNARNFLDQFGSRMEIIISEDDEPEALMDDILADAERAGIIDAPGSIRRDSPLAFVMDVLTENDAAYEWAQIARRRTNPIEIEDREQLLAAIYA